MRSRVLGSLALVALVMAGTVGAVQFGSDDKEPTTVVPAGSGPTEEISLRPEGSMTGVGSVPQGRPAMTDEEERASLVDNARASQKVHEDHEK